MIQRSRRHDPTQIPPPDHDNAREVCSPDTSSCNRTIVRCTGPTKPTPLDPKSGAGHNLVATPRDWRNHPLLASQATVRHPHLPA